MSPRVQANIGCDLATLRAHLEAQFEQGMTWHNRGAAEGRWSVDHVQPLSSFDLTDPAQYRQAFSFLNLQPRWHGDNLRKGNRTCRQTESNKE